MPNLITEVKNDIKHWWVFLVAGVVLIAMGILVYAFPVTFFVSLSLILGILISVEGAIHVWFALANQKKLPGWGWVFATGAMELLLGLFLITYSGITIITLPLVISFWLMLRGAALVSYSINLRKHHAGTWAWLLTGGILTVLFALLIIYNPLLGAFFIVLWAGIGFIIAGIFNIILAFHFRKFSNEIIPDITTAEDTIKRVL